VIDMNLVVQIFALLTALFQVLAFAWESVLFTRPGVHRGIFRLHSEDVRPARVWAFNIGFYNLFLAAGIVGGLIAHWAGDDLVGRTLVLYCCSFVFLAGLVLFASDRMALSRKKGSGVVGSLAQSVPALVTVVALLADTA